MDPAVGLVKVYLELSGYFVLTELPVRVADGDHYRDATDLDIIAVRFPHTPVESHGSTRPLDALLGDDPALTVSNDSVDVIIGEVKEGEARLNPALRREETVAFALRRLGCCPEEAVAEEARQIAHGGMRQLWMPGRVRCRVRLVVFAGYGGHSAHQAHIVPLGHCLQFIGGRLQEAWDVLGGVQFKDPVLAFIALQQKVGRLSSARADA